MSNDVMQDIVRALQQHPQVFHRGTPLWQTLRDIETLDKHFEETGGAFLHLGRDAFETAANFRQIHLRQYRQAGLRPSLPALAAYHAARLGIEKGSADYAALMLVAVRAEMKGAAAPEFHSKFHFVDVAAMTANFLESDSSLSVHEKTLAFVAAIGHDLDHEGRSNPHSDPAFNEQKSFEAMKPLLQAAGLSAADISKINTILIATSPNGAHEIIRDAAQARREGRKPDMAKNDPQNSFPALKVLGQDARLLQMTAIVCDADIYGSSGAGLEASNVMSGLLSQERRKEDPALDITSNKARNFFLNNFIGKDGYASNAARAAANASFHALRLETSRRLSKAPALRAF